ncbi:MAG: TerB family tellurite resistance protein [Pseudomonadota bacterium]
MGILDFSAVRNLFGGEPSAEERKELFDELLVMVLSRATHADTNIKAVEVEAVQLVLQERFSVEVSVADIRTAALSEAYETRPLDKYVAAASKNLTRDERIALLSALAKVLSSDDRMSQFEVSFFDDVAKAMKAAPSEVAGLSAAED